MPFSPLYLRLFASQGVVNGDLPAENHTYDTADTDLLDAFRRKVRGTTEHQKIPLEPAILVKLHDDYMRAQNVYVAWIRA